MRAALLGAALLLAPVGLPAQPAAACPAPSIPAFPGTGGTLAVTSGNQYVATSASLLDVQRFYYMRLPNEGWEPVTQLPGQYAEQHAGPDYAPMDVAQGVLEFSRDNGREHVRIVGDGGGYSIWVDCRD